MMFRFSQVEVCTSGAPGQKECDSAVRSIQSVRPLLQHPSEPVSDLGYYQCVDTIIEHSKTLGNYNMLPITEKMIEWFGVI